jgi:EspG family
MMVVRDRTDVTVNLDGLWLLQALLGVSQLAPELRALPYGEPRSGQAWVTQHPGLSVLADQGICDEAGIVRPDVAERMAVLAVPDVEVVIVVSPGALTWPRPSLDEPSTWRAIPDGQLRIVLTRRDGRWASAARAGDQVTIDDCTDCGAEWLARLVCDALDVVHAVEPAKFQAVNVPLDELGAAAGQRMNATTAAAKDAALRAVGLRGAALAQLGAVLDDPVAEAVLYARAYVDTATVCSESVLDLRDSASGRVASYRLNPPRGSEQEWMTVGPATPAHVGHGVSTVFASVPVESWASHTRMG